MFSFPQPIGFQKTSKRFFTGGLYRECDFSNPIEIMMREGREIERQTGIETDNSEKENQKSNKKEIDFFGVLS